jgi:hypothetical protein
VLPPRETEVDEEGVIEVEVEENEMAVVVDLASEQSYFGRRCGQVLTGAVALVALVEVMELVEVMLAGEELDEVFQTKMIWIRSWTVSCRLLL